MSNFLAMLQQQRQAPVPSLVPDFAPAIQGLMQGYDQGQQLRRQQMMDAQAQEDRKAKLAEAERTRKEEQLKYGMARAKGLFESGDRNAAGGALNALVPLENELYPGLGSKPLVGGMRMLSDPELQGMDEQAIRNSFRLGDQGQVQFKAQDFNNELSGNRMAGILGVKPEYKSYSDQETVMRFMPGQAPTVVRQGTPKPPSLSTQYKVINGQLVDLTTQQPVYTAPMNPYQQDQSARGWAGVQNQQSRLQLDQQKLDESVGQFNIKTMADAAKTRNTLSVRLKSAYTDDFGNFDKAGYDAAMKQANQSIDNVLRARKLLAAANAVDPKAIQQSGQAMGQRVNQAMRRVLGEDLTAMQQAFPREYQQMLDYFTGREQGTAGVGSPVKADRIRQMKAAVKGGARPAAAQAPATANVSPKDMMRRIVNNPNATIEIEDQ